MRHQHPQFIEGGIIGYHPAAERDGVLFIILVEKFGAKFGHVHVGGAFRLAGLAGKAEIEGFGYLPMVKRVAFGGMGKEFAEDIGAGAGGIALVLRRLIRGAHRTIEHCRFLAIGGTIALLDSAEDAVGIRKIKDRL